jgi:hypothetical protein
LLLLLVGGVPETDAQTAAVHRNRISGMLKCLWNNFQNNLLIGKMNVCVVVEMVGG